MIWTRVVKPTENGNQIINTTIFIFIIIITVYFYSLLLPFEGTLERG